MAENARRKIAIIGVSSLLLVAMVVAITVGSLNKAPNKHNRADVSASTKAIKTICDSTDYKETCINSLKSTAGNASDPKQLIEAAFQVTIKYIKDAMNKSSVVQNLQQDNRTSLALETCRELADHAVGDLQKSLSMFQSFDFNNLKDMLNDMKIWISGAITYQETCLDGFEDAPGDAGQKMREALKIAMQLTSNGLAMITDVSSVITSLDISSYHSRRLLSDKFPILGHGEDLDFPDWLASRNRVLLDSSPNKTKPDLVVAKDGSGKYSTINEALKDIPNRSNRTFILYIKEGVYEEKLQFTNNHTHLMVIGDGPTKTRITGKLSFKDGSPTYRTATVTVLGDHFIAKDIGFENSAGPEKNQAVALRVGADKSIFYNCHMDGYQSTLYAHTYRQFYRNCVISGTVDFIFGDSAAVLQNCTLLVRKPQDNQQCTVTAQGRKDIRQPTGLVLQNCSFVADTSYSPQKNKIKSYLGRPWKEFSRTIIMESFIDDLIQPEGWVAWNGSFAQNTLFYTEFNNRGPGSTKTQRVQWSGVKELPAARVQRYTAARFIEAETWIPATGVPFDAKFIFPVPKANSSVKYSPVAPEEIKDLGHPKQNGSSELDSLIDGSMNASPTTSPTPSTTADTTYSTAESPSPGGAFAPSPARAASPPLQSGLAPSPSPYKSVSSPTPAPSSTVASPPTQGGVSPAAAPRVSAAAPTPGGFPPSAAPYLSTASPLSLGGGTPPSAAPYLSAASPTTVGRVPTPSAAPYGSAAPPPQRGGAPPSPSPYISTTPPPLSGATPPSSAPYINAVSPTIQKGTSPTPSPYINAASPPVDSGLSPSPLPSNNAPSPPLQGATPPSPAPYVIAASPPTESATLPPPPQLEATENAASPPTESATLPPPPQPKATENAASPPTESATLPPPSQPEATENAAPPPSSLSEVSQAVQSAAQSPQGNKNSPPESSPTPPCSEAAAAVNSPTSSSLPETSAAPSSQ